MSSSKTAAFSMRGAEFTTLVRDFWTSHLPHLAIQCFTDSGQTIEMAVKVCTGEMKVIGQDADMEIVKDGSVTYPGLHSLIETMENSIIDAIVNLQYKIRASEDMLAEDIEGIYEDFIADKWENLEKIYVIVGMTLADFPLWRIATAACGLESNKKSAKLSGVSCITCHQSEEQASLIRNIQTSNLDSGYISPKGEFYGCFDEGHLHLADEMCDQQIIPISADHNLFDIENWLEENGWIKLSKGRIFFRYTQIENLKPMTNEQVSALLDYLSARIDNKKYYLNTPVLYNDDSYTLQGFFEMLEKERGEI